MEDVNNRVMAGVPFREAYREIGEQVQQGIYQAGMRDPLHTRESSIGNLCLEQIRDKFVQRKSHMEYNCCA